jgi:hypothetical protein
LSFVLQPLLPLLCCFGVRITPICRIVILVAYVSYCDVFFRTGRNHHPVRVDFGPNNMLLFSLDRVNGLLLPMKIEPGVDQWAVMSMGRDLRLYLPLQFLISNGSQ